MRALDDMVEPARCSTSASPTPPAGSSPQANTLADLRGWTRFAGLQVPYSLVSREVERDLLPMAKALELTVTAWSPLAGGLLTGRYGSDRERPKDTRIAATGEYGESRLTERNLAIADALNEIAAEGGATASQIAIAWVHAQQQRSVIIPILGARTRAQIEDTLGALDVELTDAELNRLNEVSRIELGFPHDFGGTLAYGEKFELIDDHRRLVEPAAKQDTVTRREQNHERFPSSCEKLPLSPAARDPLHVPGPSYAFRWPRWRPVSHPGFVRVTIGLRGCFGGLAAASIFRGRGGGVAFRAGGRAVAHDAVAAVARDS